MFSGRKGGGSKSSGSTSAVRTPDNLRSQDTVEVILAVCEGEIKGLRNGLNSFYIGDTKLENDDGTFNFQNFQITVHPGSGLEELITPTLGGFGKSKSVGVNLYSGTPVVRQGTIADIDALDIRLVVNQLYRQDSKGVYTSDIQFSIEYKPVSTTDWKHIYGVGNETITISGKTTSSYVKEFRVPVEKIDEPYEIRVLKISPESDTKTYFREISWESFQEITIEPKSFIDTACVHIVGQSSDQFSSLPGFTGNYDLQIVNVPSNYDPETRVYTGAWDGTFKRAWTDNPSWCTYDFLDDDRYGMRAYFPINIDKWDFYEIAQWCDVLVSDGRGGTQPRFTMNLLINEAQSGRELARYMAGSFNAMFMDDMNGTVKLKVDKEEDAIHLFTEENVVEGEFSYSFTDPAVRYNDITVTFVNPELNWKTDRRRVFDQADIDRNGRVVHNFAAVGCTNEGESYRRANYKLLTGLTEKMSVSFKANRQGQSVQLFDIMVVADPNMGTGLSGRIKTLTPDRQTVMLRDAIYFEAGIQYVMEVTTQTGLTRVDVNIESASGYKTQFTTNSALPSNLPTKAVFSLEAQGLAGFPKPYRVISIDALEGEGEIFEIVGMEINRNKWADIDNYVIQDTPDFSFLPSITDIPDPDSVTFMEFYQRETNSMYLTLKVDLDRGKFPYYSQEFEVWSREVGSTGGWERRDISGGDTIINHPKGDYDFKVLPKSYVGTKRPLDQARIWNTTVTSVEIPPLEITTFLFRVGPNGREITWAYEDTVGDLEGFRIRYHFGTNTSWADAIPAYAGLVVTAPFNIEHLPKGDITLMIKPVDRSGVEAVNHAWINAQQGDEIVANVVAIQAHYANWSGTLTQGTVSSDILLANDNSSLFWKTNSSANFWGSLTNQFWQETFMEMTYQTYTTSPGDSWLTVDLDVIGDAYSVSYADLNGVPFWGAANDLFWGNTNDPFWNIPAFIPWPGKLFTSEKDRYLFKITVASGPTRGKVEKLDFKYDVDDVSEYLNDVVISSSGTRLALTNSYRHIKNVRVTSQTDGGNAVNIIVLDKDPILGPLVVGIDKDNNYTTALGDFEIQGY
jgi:predicted phage tail protein